jgi:two-component system sensor histidine kinase TctE
MRSSIRTRLFIWLLVPATLLLGFNVWLTYSNAEETATVVQDRMLLGSARMIGQHVTYEEGLLESVVPPAALELFQSSTAADQVYYSVVTLRGELLAGYAGLPAPPSRPGVEGWVFHDAAFRDNPVRIVSFVQPIFGAREHASVVVEVAQTLRSRNALAREILVRPMQQQLFLVALVLLMLWLGLSRALAPVLRMSEEVRARKPGALEPLDVSRVPSELKALVMALNDYVHRLENQMSAHSRFVSNAAHQLRTPLTLLNTQVTCALRSTDSEGKDSAIRSIHDSVQHGIRVVNQLLTLTVAESRGAHLRQEHEVDLGRIVQAVLEQQAALAQAKSIDLGFECHAGPVSVRAVPSMLHELVANLVDNALRYTPAGGIVTAIVARTASGAQLRVEDNGPGIPATERERVFERFYRLRHDASDGCGLGLAIVREIAVTSAAEVSLGDAPGGTGLAVTVTFPARPAEATATPRPARAQFAADVNSVV